jgi:hypothetical protein
VRIVFEPLLHGSNYPVSGLGAAWGGMAVFDSLVFAMTVYKTLSLRRSGVSLIYLLLRDGKLRSHLSCLLPKMLKNPGSVYFRCET